MPTHLVFWIWNPIMAVAQIANCRDTETLNLQYRVCIIQHFDYGLRQNRKRAVSKNAKLWWLLFYVAHLHISFKGCSFNEPLRKWPVNCRFWMFFSIVEVLLLLELVLTILPPQRVFCFFCKLDLKAFVVFSKRINKIWDTTLKWPCF